MAVVLVNKPLEYTGLSSDDKPTTGVPAGSVFWEFTSGDPYTILMYIFDGTQWGLVTSTAAA